MRFNFLYYSVIVYVFVYIIIYYTDIERLIEIKSPLFLSADFYQTTLDSLCVSVPSVCMCVSPKCVCVCVCASIEVYV